MWPTNWFTAAEWEVSLSHSYLMVVFEFSVQVSEKKGSPARDLCECFLARLIIQILRQYRFLWQFGWFAVTG